MNFIAIIILVFIIFDYFIHVLADFLNLKILNNNLPDAFAGIYDDHQYQKSQHYLKVNTRFGWVSSTFSLLVVLAFWFGRGFPFLDQWIRGLNRGEILTGLIYMGILILLRSLLFLPLKIYDTFVIEDRFGFNKTTWQTFIKDIMKVLALSIVLGVPLLAGILAFFEFAGANAWWYCWITAAFFMVVVQFVAPNWIMPLFNKFDPLEEGELKASIMSYARSINFPLKNIYVMDGSKRSGKSNAFFTGFGKYRRIVLFDTLIDQHTVSELLAILAHEMGHYKMKHIQKMMLVGIAQMGIMFFLLSLCISYPALFEAFYMQQPSVYAGMIFFGMLYSPIDFVVGMLFQIYSRKNEFQADQFAVKTTGDSQALASALKKLSVHNLSNLTPHSLYVFLNYSHPPVLDRVNSIRGRSKFS